MSEIPRSTAFITVRLLPTQRELAILHCAARGLSSQETGRELFIAPETVKFHKSRLFRKLSARTIGQAVAIGYQRGYLHVEGDPQVPPPVVEVNGVLYGPVDPSDGATS